MPGRRSGLVCVLAGLAACDAAPAALSAPADATVAPQVRPPPRTGPALDASLIHDASATPAIAAEPIGRAVALRSWTPVRREPRRDAELAGYLRAGATVDLESGPWGADGCPTARDGDGEHGWYRVGGGGFLCVGGENAAHHPASDVHALSPPDLDASLPYRYAIVYGRTNLYRRFPTEADLRQYEPWRAPGAVPSPAVPPARPRLSELVGDPTSPVMRRLITGMYVALDRYVRDTERSARYWRTQSGGLVVDERLSDVRHASTYQGVELDASHALPIGWMVSEVGSIMAVTPDGGVGPGERSPRLSPIALSEGAPLVAGPRAYLRTADGRAVLADNVRRASLRAPPEGVGALERWIDVDLDEQVLVAYEGARPVFATLVSSGRRSNRPDGTGFDTPTGTFRVQSKHVTATMDGDTASDGPYSIEDVPWVMYFEGSYALHAAFWHSYFGWRMSHGCVNLSPSDARRLFFWSEPRLPRGWHGVHSDGAHPGTRVELRHSRGDQGTELARPDDVARGSATGG